MRRESLVFKNGNLEAGAIYIATEEMQPSLWRTIIKPITIQSCRTKIVIEEKGFSETKEQAHQEHRKWVKFYEKNELH